ncbi:MAG: PrsW family glutamic-type intramembrane protease [bacterium]|nr:PrsW family glutamic-type intramembrane protease [bacterium]
MRPVEPEHRKVRRIGLWWQILLQGLILYAVGVSILSITRNSNLFPAVTMLGSFLIPVTYVVLFYNHRHLSRLKLLTIAKGFFYGGVLGVFAAALLEPLFVQRLTFFTAFRIGLIEEFAKVLGVVLIAQRHRHNSELDGLILGAAAGMGFAALESTGYAFTAFLHSGGSLSLTVYITLLRGILSPLGHGTWTAILVSIMFRESRPGRFRFNSKVVGAYLLVAGLHGLWNGLPNAMSAMLQPLVNALTGQIVVGGIGVIILWRRWDEAVRLQEAAKATGE